MKTCTTTTRPTVYRSLPTVLRAKGDKTFRCKVASNGTRVVALMNFGKKLRMDSESAGVFASQGRDDYSESDVQYYFEYAGMLAVEKTYDKMDQLLATGVAPVDLLLLMAASEGDRQKIEELMRAGASYEIKDTDGRTALDRACDDEIRELILSLSN